MPLQILAPGPLPFVIVTIAGLTWKVTYEWDDGTLWRFDATNGAETRTMFEDHTAGGGGPRGDNAPPSEVTQRVHAALRPSYWQIDATAQRILDLMAERLATDARMTGRLLRQQLGLSVEQTGEAFQRLAKRYVDAKRDGHGRDYYELRLPGMLQSKMHPQFAEFMEGTLGFYAGEYGHNANVMEFDIRRLCKAICLEDVALARQYLAIARLAAATPNSVVPVPADMEQLSELRTLADFLGYIREGDRSDLSPTAPLIQAQGAEVVDAEAGHDSIPIESASRPSPPSRPADAGTAEDPTEMPSPTEVESMTVPAQPAPRRNVFVVHGHDQAAVDDLFSFLSGIGLTPVSWDHAKSMARPGLKTNADVVRAAIEGGEAIVVLFTPDEIARRSPHLGGEPDERYQPRPNVLLETGWAIGEHSEKTVIVEAGMVNRVSDIDGVQCIRMSDHTSLAALAEELRHIGCDVDTKNSRYNVVARFPRLFKERPPLASGGREAAPQDLDDDTLVEMLKHALPRHPGFILHTKLDDLADVPSGTSGRLGERAAREKNRLEKATAGGLTLNDPANFVTRLS